MLSNVFLWFLKLYFSVSVHCISQILRGVYVFHIVICISLILITLFLNFCQPHFSNSEIDVLKEEKGKVECYLAANWEVCIFLIYCHVYFFNSESLFLSFCQLHFSNSEIDAVKEEKGKVECYLAANWEVWWQTWGRNITSNWKLLIGARLYNFLFKLAFNFFPFVNNNKGHSKFRTSLTHSNSIHNIKLKLAKPKEAIQRNMIEILWRCRSI